VLNRHFDTLHNRSVYTIAAEPPQLVEALTAGAAHALDLIDLRTHQGLHPHVGALDVCPVVWQEEERHDDAVAAACEAAAGIAALGIPVFFYGELAANPERAERAYFRRGGPAELARRMGSGELQPDLGPSEPHPTAGATLVTAREPLVNWISAQSMPPLLPPYSAGSARSGLIAMLGKGHNGVRLAREEMDKLAAWIDLAVPFCGDYLEANAWSDEERARYRVFEEKRERLAAEERQNVAAWLAEKEGTPEAAPAVNTTERNTKVALELLDAAGAVQARAKSPAAGTSATLKMDREYRPGDRFRISGAEHLVLRLGAGLPESLVYAPNGMLEWPIPVGPQRRAYPPAAFAGAAHQVSARAATRAELDGYRNLALNPWDVRVAALAGSAPAPVSAPFFPHASSNNECRNDPVFFARCAIDGNLLNRRHGAWPYESWGPARGKGIWWRLDFGRPVQIDRIAIAARADFPHDSVWPRLAVEYSDGSRDTLRLKTTDQLQQFPIRPRTVAWLRFANLDAPPAPNNQGWRALTEVQVWGREAAPGEELARDRVHYRVK
jgi:hypothetical protein